MGSKVGFKHRKWLRSAVVLTLLLSLVMQSACMQNGKNSGNNSVAQSTKGKSKALSVESPKVNNVLTQNQFQKQNQTDNLNKLPLVSQNGVQYVNAQKLITMLGFQSKWNAENASFLIGDKDPNYVIKLNSKEAQKDGESIKLASPPIMIDKSAYIPLSAIGDLFQQDMSFEVKDNQIIVQDNQKDTNFSIKSVNDQMNDSSIGNYLDFADDPDDPNKSLASSALTDMMSVMKNVEGNDSDVAALANVNIPSLVNKSKQYLGVRYDFGASPYPQSGAFDCSTFTQYIYGKYGIKLRRLARDQAKQGISVSRKNLRVGDLLFFNVPGRFRSSNTVGHVGIYLGNNTMIDADIKPKNGVQYTNINKAYWKRVYLSAKRVAY